MPSPAEVLSPELLRDLETLLRDRFGADTVVTECFPISQRAAITMRATLGGSAAPASVFVKHLHVSEYPAVRLFDSHVEFAEELLALQFLEQCTPSQPFRAKLVAGDARGLIVLEDLGPEGHAEMRRFDELVELVSAPVAMMHAATRNRMDLYWQLRAEAQLGDAESDRRRYGKPAQRRRFALGRDYLLGKSAAQSLAQTHEQLRQELNAAEAEIESPDEFFAFIHDDLGNARQTFEMGDRLYLLDFKYAKAGHCLIDLCKPTLGKFALNLDNGVYLWSNPNFPLTFAAAYRRRWQRETGLIIDDARWDNALSSAFVYYGLTLVGRLMHLEPDRVLLGTVRQNINGILYRLDEVLPAHSYPALKAFTARFLAADAASLASLNPIVG